jgi:hypothetical protein
LKTTRIFGLSRSSILHKTQACSDGGKTSPPGGAYSRHSTPDARARNDFFSRSLMRGILKALRRVAKLW